MSDGTRKPTVRVPFFDDFRCVGPDCPVSCCTGFRFPLRREEAEMLPRGVWTEDGEGPCLATRPNGDCPLWTPGHRCPLQKGADQRALPTVCRLFPRIVSEYPDRTEACLDAMCPEVYRLIATWEIGDLRVDGGAQIADAAFRRRTAEMAVYRTLPFAGTEPAVADYLRRVGAYLLVVHYPVYADAPKAEGVFGPVRRFVETLAPRTAGFRGPGADLFALVCGAWRSYARTYGFDVESDGCFRSAEEAGMR